MLPALPPSEVFAFHLDRPAETRSCHSGLPTDAADTCRNLVIGDDHQDLHHMEDVGPLLGLSVSVVDPVDSADVVVSLRFKEREAGHLVAQIASGEVGPLMSA
jgi:hypothetical protein